MPNRFDYSPFASIAPSLQPRSEVSRQLADDVEAFLRRGGQIATVEQGVSLDSAKTLKQLREYEYARNRGAYTTGRRQYIQSARRGRRTQARERGDG